QAQGINTSSTIILGMAISNGLIGLAGALFVQTQGFSDVSMGIGTIVIGLAAVIIGEAVLNTKRIFLMTLAVIIGAILYRLFVQIALSSEMLRGIGFKSQDLNLVTALLVVVVLMLPKIKAKLLGNKAKGVSS
ncbi:MAG: ABC transporter permease, partial [Moraxella sp.]|nr:ABC transporter permease [Moraxella sp.]